ncbi:hypothetical protein [Methanosarcina barkeri]|nr:hypothetical protein [Methanosarcina barkeri]
MANELKYWTRKRNPNEKYLDQLSIFGAERENISKLPRKLIRGY